MDVRREGTKWRYYQLYQNRKCMIESVPSLQLKSKILCIIINTFLKIVFQNGMSNDLQAPFWILVFVCVFLKHIYLQK